MRTWWSGVAAALAAALAACGDARPSARSTTPGGCGNCHGSLQNPAPPLALSGSAATTEVGVGAHQLHLRDTPVRSAVPCSECHLVPAEVDSPGHADSGPPAEVTFGPLATHQGSATPATPSWSRSPDARCSGVYCHGATMRSPPAQGPVWTLAQEPDPGRPGVCATCHGAPPPLPHPQSTSCSICHPETVRQDGTIDVAGGKHIDGTLQVSGLGCSSCHGSAQNPAPPVDTLGSSDTTRVTVGAHQLHLRDTPVRSAIPCSECHLVPAAVDSPGHIDTGPPAEVTFGPLATHQGSATPTTPSWSRSPDARCSGVYCHGATMSSPPAQGPVWTFAQEPDPGRPGVCSTCHGWPPPPPHLQLTGCNTCHPATVLPDGSIDVAGGKHIDGILEMTISGGCAGCHGFPPATGAHTVHFGLTGVAGSGSYGDLTVLQDRFPTSTPTTAPPVYAFGCGHCHPLDQVKHLDGAVEVEVYDAAAPAGSLKARASPAAAYSGGLDGTCSGTYCHSSGQETPSWTKPRDGAAIASPAWSSGQSLGCTGCHDNPPAYPSGGPGAPDANGHVGLRDDGYVWGHFGGLPGPSLYSKHGKLGFGDDASPITCQTCHVDTVDPANTGPSAFYYLDTTGDYTFGGGVLDDACAVCHTGGGATTGTGRILPLRHVNGTRDVVFDARTSLPQGISWLPAAPNRPSRPYWASNASLSSYPPDTSGFDGTTFSLTLGASGVTPAASYDAPTKTCSSVACHLDSTGPVWGTGYATSGPASGCADCHHF